MSPEERLLKIKTDKVECGHSTTNELLIIIAEELISINKMLNNMYQSFNQDLDSIEYSVRTKK